MRAFASPKLPAEGIVVSGELRFLVKDAPQGVSVRFDRVVWTNLSDPAANDKNELFCKAAIVGDVAPTGPRADAGARLCSRAGGMPAAALWA